MSRWYKGFQCRGNVQVIIEAIKKVVQWHKLGSMVPVLRIENLEGKRTKQQKFWLFLAIESPNIGEIPEKVQSTLLHIAALNRPEKEPFTYEQIQTMVGPEHEVYNYARSIPYFFYTPQSLAEDPFDQDDTISDQNDQEDNLLNRTKQYDQLMLWLSVIGSGSWHMFRNACQTLSLDHDGLQSRRILRNLRLLGHLESSRSGNTWVIAPPVLVLLNDTVDEKEREYLFCGGRDNMLLQALHSIAKVQTLPQRDGNAPATLYVWARESIEVISYITGIPSTFQLTITNNASYKFAKALPSLVNWMHNLEVLDGIMPHMFEMKKFNGNTFIDNVFQYKSGFYQLWLTEQYANVKKLQYTLFYDEASRHWLRGDWYGLRFLSRQLDNNSCPVRYEPISRRLAVPKTWRWPELYERALVLASGRLPNQSDLWLIYDNIGPEVVHEFSAKLNLREEETSHA